MYVMMPNIFVAGYKLIENILFPKPIKKIVDTIDGLLAPPTAAPEVKDQLLHALCLICIEKGEEVPPEVQPHC
jgi:hypothetical protein